MRPTLLIAFNFAREQLWPLFFLLLWVLGWAAVGLVSNPRTAGDDVLMIFRQLAAYSVAFSLFFGSSAVRSDQQSRRILLVLSKGISRTQYLLGLLTGIGLVVGAFCLSLGFTAIWILGAIGFEVPNILMGILFLFSACLLTSTLTLLLSTFLPAVFAAVGSGLAASLPAVMGGSALSVFPVYALLQPLLASDTAWRFDLQVLVLAVVQIGLLFAIAAWIFSRRDLAIAGE